MQAGIASPIDVRDSGALAWLVSIGLVIICLAVIAGGGLAGLVGWWQRDEGSHGWLIPFISGFVLWQRRQRLLAARSASTWWGFACMGLGLVLLLVDELGQLQRFGLPALVTLAFGGVLATLGWRSARYAAVPLAYLLFAMPPPGPLYVWLSLQLQFVSSELGAAMLQLMGISVFLDGNVIDLGVYKMQVAEACSGLRYLFPLTSFAFLCAWMYRAPAWAKFVVLLSVIPITILTNSARIAMTGVFIEYGSIELAEGFMHLFEGWVIFIVALLILFALMWLLSRLRGYRGGVADLLDFDRLAGAHIDPARPASRTNASGSAAAWLGLPAPWLAAVALILLAVPAHATMMNRDQIVPVRPGLVTFPVQFGDWRGQPSSIDAQTQEILGSTDYFLGDFVQASNPGVVNLWIAYYGTQVKSAAMHTPQQCLPGAGWEFVSLETINSPTANANGETFSINRALITDGRQEMLVYYWLEARGGQYANPQMFKASNVKASLFEGRSDGALVRLITPLLVGESEAEADARLVDFITLAYPALEPHVGR